jgi:hypothetical protein
MLIRNERSDEVVSDDAEELTRSWQHVRGLMFSPKRDLVFTFPDERCRTLHMWFVFYMIDVVFLDASRTVVDVKRGFMPFRVYRSEVRSKYVVELPRGCGDVRVGDTFVFEKDL